MPNPASSPSHASPAPPGSPQQLPYLLTAAQGQAARTLLSYAVSLPLPSTDAQLLAAVLAIRGRCGHRMRLTDLREEVHAAARPYADRLSAHDDDHSHRHASSPAG
ncbi:hypothetical protein GCM10009760_55550 [Kitasatospora kazusensis]|uniref:Uncharacterized protein n=1 Tax=Kitasatospora kazusensis TaxID=407974 RepID=A0ABN3A7E0_9ACTN